MIRKVVSSIASQGGLRIITSTLTVTAQAACDIPRRAYKTLQSAGFRQPRAGPNAPARR
ncbi:MAG: hypothetical protein JF586_23060 [Burkholderiales bacterium]|nr:hypothetical protein [Burkholderiales bacterium]